MIGEVITLHYKEVKGILSAKNGMNLYRGCTHGCIYCDSRSRCYQINHDFEDIEVKSNALLLLEKALGGKRKKCMIGTGAMTDPYIHLEQDLEHTRKSLALIDKYKFGLAIQTKSDRILRDLDLLISINQKAKCVVQMTLTTYDESLSKIIEPQVATTKQRFEILQTLKENGIPTVVWLTPLLPYINDTEANLRGILDYCIQAEVYGIICFGIGLTLREGNREYFYTKLDQHFPGLRQRYHKKYGYQYIITSDNNNKLMEIFFSKCRKHNIVSDNEQIFRYLHTFPDNKQSEQLKLFT